MMSVFRKKKGGAVEKQQFINECHLKVNPNLGQVQAGFLRERFDVIVHRNQLMEKSRQYL